MTGLYRSSAIHFLEAHPWISPADAPLERLSLERADALATRALRGEIQEVH